MLHKSRTTKGVGLQQHLGIVAQSCHLGSNITSCPVLRSVYETICSLVLGELELHNLEPLEVILRDDGHWYSLSNRRLFAIK
eukprot:5283278-Amphidinium_carterae.1